MISNLEDMSGVVWSPTEEYFAFLGDKAGNDEPGSGLYVYSMKQRKYRLVARKVSKDPQWSPNGRFLVSIRQASEDLPGRLGGRGALLVLDSRRRFKPAFTIGHLVSPYLLSPSGNKLAFVDLVKDEYADFSNHSLGAVDFRTGRIYKLTINRRKPDFIWAGDDALAVTTYDKYAVPTLSLMNLNGDKTKLVTARSFARLEPVEYQPKRNRIVYKAMKSLWTGREPEELWAVEPGRRPIHLPPRKNARTR